MSVCVWPSFSFLVLSVCFHLPSLTSPLQPNLSFAAGVITLDWKTAALGGKKSHCSHKLIHHLNADKLQISVCSRIHSFHTVSSSVNSTSSFVESLPCLLYYIHPRQLSLLSITFILTDSNLVVPYFCNRRKHQGSLESCPLTSHCVLTLFSTSNLFSFHTSLLFKVLYHFVFNLTSLKSEYMFYSLFPHPLLKPAPLRIVLKDLLGQIHYQ